MFSRQTDNGAHISITAHVARTANVNVTQVGIVSRGRLCFAEQPLATRRAIDIQVIDRAVYTSAEVGVFWLMGTQSSTFAYFSAAVVPDSFTLPPYFSPRKSILLVLPSDT